MLAKALELWLKYREFYLNGALFTMIVSLSGTVIGLVLGLLLSFLRDLRPREHESKLAHWGKEAVRRLSTAYIEYVRGTPMIVQAVFLYYAGYKLLHWTPISAGIVIVSLNTAAYMAEIIRSGIQSIDRGQREAALSMGMSEGLAFRLIILPQAIRNAFPSIGNEFVVNIKDTSVLNVIMLTDLFFEGMSVAGSTYAYTASMFVVANIYFILTFSVTRLLMLVERRLNLPAQGGIKSVSVPHLGLLP